MIYISYLAEKVDCRGTTTSIPDLFNFLITVGPLRILPAFSVHVEAAYSSVANAAARQILSSET